MSTPTTHDTDPKQAPSTGQVENEKPPKHAPPEPTSRVSRGAILDADDLDRTEVEVPEWGVTLYIRELPGYEAQELRDAITEDDTYSRELTIIRCAVDENGDAIFRDGDEKALSKKSNRVLERLAGKALEVNGWGEDAAEQMVGNSRSGTTSSGGSA